MVILASPGSRNRAARSLRLAFAGPELEAKIADLIARHMNRPGFRAGIIHNVTADETAERGTKLSTIGEPENGASDDARNVHMSPADRIEIAPGEIRIFISAERLAVVLDLDQTRVVEDLLVIASTFRHRKRGVETKLIIGDEPAEIDETLVRNIARAHRYFDLVRSGETFGEIAETEGDSKRRIQQLIELAFLALDVIRAAREGIIERTQAGLKAAATRGRKGGRKPVVTPKKLEQARAHISDGLTVREAAARLKISKTSLYNALRDQKVG